MRTGTNTFCRKCGRFEPSNERECGNPTDCASPFNGQARCQKCGRMGFLDCDRNYHAQPCKCWKPEDAEEMEP